MTLTPSAWRLSPPLHETTDKGHGRIENRKLWSSSDLIGFIDFPLHQQVARIERTTTDLRGKLLHHEVVFAITSLSDEEAGPAALANFIRAHWSIESHHWVRDMTFDEDRSQIRTKSAPQVMAALRNLVIGIFRLKGLKKIASALRYYASRSHLTLGLIGL
jgi:predicted transposase YbfD/YdcC